MFCEYIVPCIIVTAILSYYHRVILNASIHDSDAPLHTVNNNTKYIVLIMIGFVLSLSILEMGGCAYFRKGPAIGDLLREPWPRPVRK